jgi:non-heme chloroperoxidase
MTFIIKAVEIPNRIKVPYVEQGDPSGVPRLLLRGVTDSWHSFERVLTHLPPSVHAFALTQRAMVTQIALRRATALAILQLT